MRVVLGPADVAEGELRPFETSGRWVLVTRHEGSLHALDDMCNHAGCLLSGGWMQGPSVVCPCHEYSFDVRSGANTTIIRLCDDQPVFPLEIVDGQLVVTLPEPRR